MSNPPTPDADEMIDFIRSEVTSSLGVAVLIGADDDLFELGMDSIDAVELTAAIESRFDISIDPNLALEESTARKIAAAVNRRPN